MIRFILIKVEKEINFNDNKQKGIVDNIRTTLIKLLEEIMDNRIVYIVVLGNGISILSEIKPDDIKNIIKIKVISEINIIGNIRHGKIIVIAKILMDRVEVVDVGVVMMITNLKDVNVYKIFNVETKGLNIKIYEIILLYVIPIIVD